MDSSTVNPYAYVKWEEITRLRDEVDRLRAERDAARARATALAPAASEWEHTRHALRLWFGDSLYEKGGQVVDLARTLAKQRDAAVSERDKLREVGERLHDAGMALGRHVHGSRALVDWVSAASAWTVLQGDTAPHGQKGGDDDQRRPDC